MITLLDSWRPRLLAIAASHLGDDGAHDINHLHRVWRSATILLKTHPEADALIVLAACYLHDLVNLPKNDPQRHLASRQAAQLAVRLLGEQGFPPERLAAVAHAIEAHSFSANIAAQSIEAKIVQDADRLDALGMVGIARLFYIAGKMGSALAHPDDPLAAHRIGNDKLYALDHITLKLAGLPATMQTAAGRAEADLRLQSLEQFRDEFVAEWQTA
ncbi:HD domain-containing protein [Glaciimonas sp. PCH181]|uniref:HD domain-containing protein n=1 Tax=Glaciimonas sp. PCH181 TaxID=2133943 RepID=UPI000D3AE1AB|nr:HD domain-containing protein [Glaciimonas sp. PCH181]PUA18994.1 hydrolase [Glaciimonas sp. PCH181]